MNYNNIFKLHPFLIKIILSCVIFGLTIFVYWDAQYHQFFNFDDSVYVTSNYNVKNGFSLANIKWAFGFTDVSYWHPISWLSHMIDCQFFGDRPGAHHMMNIAIHILNAILLFFVLFRMTGSLGKSVFAALFFAVHPLNVESVAWVSERKTALSSFFLISAIHTYIYYTERKKNSVYVITLSLYALGLMSKPIILIFPFLLLLLDYWPLKRFKGDDSSDVFGSTVFAKLGKNFVDFYKSNMSILLEKIPFILLSLISLSISMVSVFKARMVVNYQVVPVYLRIENFFVSIIKYLHDIVFPWELSIFYPFPKSIPLWQLFLALAFIVTVTILALKMRKNRPWLIFGWLWFLIALLPASGLLQAGLWPAMANRFMYLPMIGIFIIIIWECDKYIKGSYSHALKFILCIAMLVYFSSIARVQNLYFTNSYAVFNRCLAVAGDNEIAFTNIGDSLVSLGRFDEAMEYFEKSIKLNPTKNFIAYHNYGICLVRKEEDLNAIPYFLRAVEINPNAVGSYLNLGLIQLRRGNVNEAEKILIKALKIDPSDLSTRYNLGNILESQNKDEEAIQLYLFVIRKDPSYLPARLSLSQIYEKNGSYDKALAEYETLLKTTPKNKAYIYYRIAGVYSKQEKLKECEHYLEIALKNDGFNVLENLKTDKNFEYFRERSHFTRFLESHELKHH